MKKLIVLALLASTLSGCGLIGGLGSGIPAGRPGRGENLFNTNWGPQSPYIPPK